MRSGWVTSPETPGILRAQALCTGLPRVAVVLSLETRSYADVPLQLRPRLAAKGASAFYLTLMAIKRKRIHATLRMMNFQFTCQDNVQTRPVCACAYVTIALDGCTCVRLRVRILARPREDCRALHLNVLILASGQRRALVIRRTTNLGGRADPQPPSHHPVRYGAFRATAWVGVRRRRPRCWWAARTPTQALLAGMTRSYITVGRQRALKSYRRARPTIGTC